MSAAIIEENDGDPYTVVITVTPDVAKRWLTKNLLNRTLRPRQVDSYVRDMLAGNWELNGESIKWSVTETLLDGQHRLRAVVKSGVTIRSFVTFNLPVSTQISMDTGIKRTPGDALGIKGQPNANQLAAIVRLALAVQDIGYQAMQNYRPTTAEMNAAVLGDPSFAEAAKFTANIRVPEIRFSSIIGYAYWRMAKIDKGDARTFWQQASTKVGFREGDPILVLVKRFGEARAKREDLPKPAMMSLIFRAWNAYRAGKTLTRLRINSTKGGLIEVPEPK